MEVSDFARFFYPAARLWLAGANPYVLPGVYNPPWAWWLLGPFVAAPVGVAWWGWLVLSVALLVGALVLVRRLAWWELGLILCSPTVLIHLAMGQWTLWLLVGTALLRHPRPEVQGTALALLSLKPHLGWPFLLLTRPRAWVVPLCILAVSLLIRPLWPLDFWASLRAEPPVGYHRLLALRSLLLGSPLLVGFALGAAGLIFTTLRRYQVSQRWRVGLLCCLAPFLSPYHRLYDNLLLFYPILILTEGHRAAWLVVVPLLWLPLILIALPWAVFVDWLPPLVLLLLLVRVLAQGQPAPTPSRNSIAPG